jgi:hypothetical protein
MKLRTYLFMVMMTLSLLGCSSTKIDPKAEALSKTNYTYEKNGVKLFVRSSKNLNLVNGRQYTLALTIVQVNSLKAATALLKKEDVLNDLVIGKPATDPAIIATDRLIISPEANEWVRLMRRTDTQAIVIFASYFDAMLEKKVRQFAIPVEIDSSGYIFKSYTANVVPLQLIVDLADTSINEIRAIDKTDDIEDPLDTKTRRSKSQKKSEAPPLTTNKVLAL